MTAPPADTSECTCNALPAHLPVTWECPVHGRTKASETPDDWGSGPNGWKDICAYVNETPPLISMLYDIDLMPEQIQDDNEFGQQQLFIIANHWRENELASNARAEAAERSNAQLRVDCDSQSSRLVALAAELAALKHDIEQYIRRDTERLAAIDAARQALGEDTK
jgi:hypothetical protein